MYFYFYVIKIHYFKYTYYKEKKGGKPYGCRYSKRESMC